MSLKESVARGGGTGGVRKLILVAPEAGYLAELGGMARVSGWSQLGPRTASTSSTMPSFTTTTTSSRFSQAKLQRPGLATQARKRAALRWLPDSSTKLPCRGVQP